MGVSSLIFLFLILLALIVIIYELKIPRPIFITQIFILYIICIAIAHLSIYSHVNSSFSFLLYSLILYSTFLAHMKDENIGTQILWMLFIATSISSIFTFMGTLGIMNLSALTGGQDSIKVTYGENSMVINNGLFLRRTGMASYFIFSISAAIMMYMLSNKKTLSSLLYLLFAILPLLSLAITANRSGILFGILGPLITYFLLNPIKNSSKILIFGLALFFGLNVLATMFPTAHYYYEIFTLADGLSSGKVQSDSDMYRIVFFLEALSRFDTNPWGYGAGPIYDVPNIGTVDPHNSVTLVIISAGLVGVFFLIYLMVGVVHSLLLIKKSNLNPASTQLLYVILSVLTSVLLFNQVHVGLNNGLLWVFLGLLISILSKSKMVRNVQKVSSQ